jgi:hypothetical protein
MQRIAIAITCTARMISSGTTSPASSQSRSVISAITRNSASAALPRSSIIRCERPTILVASSRLRMIAATIMAPM